MAWRKVLAFGLLGSAMVVGCVVGSDDDDTPIDGEAGSGGDGGDGGSTADASTGGTGGGTGGGMTGGSSGAGGSTGGSGGGTAAMCDPDDPMLSECDACVQDTCCDFWLACTDSCVDEAPCIIECTDNESLDGGVVTSDTVYGCATQCATEGSQVAETTSDLVACIIEVGDAGVSNCGLECYGLVD